MNKILMGLLIMCSMSLMAAPVLDSEQTDYEFEFEACDAAGTENCKNGATYGSNSQFYPVRNVGFYNNGPSWYWTSRGLEFFSSPASWQNGYRRDNRNGNVPPPFAK